MHQAAVIGDPTRVMRKFRGLELASQQHKNSQTRCCCTQIFSFHALAPSALNTPPRERRLSPNDGWAPGGFFQHFSWRTRNSADRVTEFALGIKDFDPKKCKKGLRDNIWVISVFAHFFQRLGNTSPISNTALYLRTSLIFF